MASAGTPRSVEHHLVLPPLSTCRLPTLPHKLEMAPKRKADAVSRNEEQSPVRRRTRATATLADHPGDPTADAPPARKTRRRAVAESEELLRPIEESVPARPVAAKPPSRSTARVRKVAGEGSGVSEPGPSVPLRRGRSKKVRIRL